MVSQVSTVSSSSSSASATGHDDDNWIITASKDDFIYGQFNSLGCHIVRCELTSRTTTTAAATISSRAHICCLNPFFLFFCTSCFMLYNIKQGALDCVIRLNHHHHRRPQPSDSIKRQTEKQQQKGLKKTIFIYINSKK